MKPFEVYNPISGRWFILHWWTDEDRGHLAFANTEESLRDAALRVFKESPYAKSKGIFEIETVAPSDRMSRMAAEHDVREEIESFYYDVFARLAEIVEAGNTLPPPFVPCDKYEPDEDVDLDEWARSRHYGCQNCMNAIRMVGMTKGDLYAKFHAGWSETHPRREPSPGRGQPVRVPSKAPKASDDEPLWFAYANFGHHAGGVELHEVDLTEGEACRPKCLTTNTLFFYRLIKEIDGRLLDEVAAMSEAAQHAAEEASERRDRAREKEREAEVAQRVRSTIGFFSRVQT